MSGIWVDIKGYEGLYQVSSLGLIKRVETIVSNGAGSRVVKEKVLQPRLHSQGYHRVSLYKNNTGKDFFIHRIVIKHFKENPENKRCVNHINGIKSDNRIENLEWCTHSENNLHNYRVLGRKPPRPLLGRTGGKSPYAKPIKCLTDDKSFDSLIEASKHYGIAKTSISAQARGFFKTVKGLRFKYLGSPN